VFVASEVNICKFHDVTTQLQISTLLGFVKFRYLYITKLVLFRLGILLLVTIRNLNVKTNCTLAVCELR